MLELSPSPSSTYLISLAELSPPVKPIGVPFTVYSKLGGQVPTNLRRMPDAGGEVPVQTDDRITVAPRGAEG